ncbi:MAG: tripartite tricarboxylate transporter substrate binding protein [Spongiibacteraceae bacterium]|nr:tripartite tricarboxylate transporter substrate binding protein [Spongiibacteraceae bacterium]
MFAALALNPALAETKKLHFLIPGGAGGGWDSTARGIGEALARSGLVAAVSYENMSGGSGTRALSHLIETADRQQHTLMISSTPIILNAVKGIFPQTYLDLRPVAAVIADYGAFVVAFDSPLRHWRDVVAAYQQDPRLVKVAGGSAKGSMDHLVAALAIKKSGLDPTQLRYIPYNAGGQAMVGLLSRETQMLSTGLSEAIALAAQGEVRILAMTAAKRLDDLPNIPTLKEQGIDAEFVNWRGLFAAPGTSDEVIAAHLKMLQKMYTSNEWEQIRARRAWTKLFIASDDFSRFLGAQQTELEVLSAELGLIRR